MGELRHQWKRVRGIITASVAAAVILAGCSGESPTSPSNPPPGTQPPVVTNPTITVTVSDPSPVSGGTTRFTVNVTQNGQPVPNGTAIQFTTTRGTFVETGTASMVRTTTNGQTTATLTSTTAGEAVVNISAGGTVVTRTITFRGAPATVAVTTSSSIADTGSAVTVTANVTRNGTPVEDGTLVEFTTDLGTFAETQSGTVVKQTAGGIATASLSSKSAGTARIVAKAKASDGSVSGEGSATVEFRQAAGPVIVLSASAQNPRAGDTVTITGTVTRNGAFVEDGTVVEFVTDRGVFTDTLTNITQKTTTAGKVTASLRSSSGGIANVVARVKAPNGGILSEGSIAISYRSGQAPLVTDVNPTSGDPSGGQIVTILGQNFVAPVRVFFGEKEAAVLSVSSTQVVVRTPQINMGASEPSRQVDIRVINAAGTSEEASVTADQKFTFQIEILTPIVYSVSPSSGPNEGHTRVTVTGEGFQSPVKVFFGTGASEVEAEIVSITFNQIVAMTPPASGLGAPLRNQSVPVRVFNVRSNKTATLANAFRYGPEMVITSVGPTQGPSTGGTRVQIDGWGFDDPVAVTIGGVAAQPIFVSGTQIIAVTSAVALASCSEVTGPITVTNIEDGGTATGPEFRYIPTQPSIVSVTPGSATEGTAVQIGVLNAGGGNARIKIGSFTIIPTSSSTSGNVTTYTLTLPTGFEFQEQACTGPGGAGQRFVPSRFNVSFSTTATPCSDSLDNGIEILPTDTSCRVPANAVVSPASMTFTGTCGTTSASQNLRVTNTGGAPLQVFSISSSITGFQIASGTAPQTLAPGAFADYQVRYQLPATPPATPTAGTIDVSTDDTTPPPATQVTLTCTP